MGDTARTGTLSLQQAGGAEHGHLLVIDEHASRIVGIPESGRLTIGRAEGMDIALVGAAVSRHHADLVVDAGAVEIHDAGSHNGTIVNGTRIDVPTPLSRGDVVGIGSANLFVYVMASADRHWSDPVTTRRDLERAVASCDLHDHPLVLAAFRKPASAESSGARWPPPLPLLAEAGVRGFVDDDNLVIAWPEWTFEEAQPVARDAAEAYALAAAVAVFPADGVDARALLEAALDAAQTATTGSVALARDKRGHLAVAETNVVALDPAMRRSFELVRQLAASTLPVLVFGETGTGKEIMARALHAWSPRSAAPFVAINCGGLADSLLTAELFGHERGAFTGADAARAGVFERAHGGTLFLDEIGELSPAGQSSLLRVLETGEVTRVGAQRPIRVDVRVVAATHRALHDDVAAGRFREDLLFRLGVATVDVPPLRRRRGEVPVLARAFAEAAAQRENVRPCQFDDAAMRLLQEYAWPGNVRELKNLVAVLAVTHAGQTIRAAHLPERVVADPEARNAAQDSPEPAVRDVTEAASEHFLPLSDEIAALEAKRMSEALVAARGVVSHAAALLGVPRRTFTMKMKRYDIQREQYVP